MKTISVTVAWFRTVEVELDETRINDDAYLDEVRSKATERAAADLNAKGGIIHDSDEPALIE